MDGVVKGLQEDAHMLDVVDSGFLVNTGKQLILVDVGAGTSDLLLAIERGAKANVKP